MRFNEGYIRTGEQFGGVWLNRRQMRDPAWCSQQRPGPFCCGRVVANTGRSKTPGFDFDAPGPILNLPGRGGSRSWLSRAKAAGILANQTC